MPNTISKTLTFEAHPPHALHGAQFENRRGASIESTTISRTERKVVEEPGSEAAGREAPAANQYIATFGHTSYPQELNWQFTLGDFLSFEQWLYEATPQAGATQSVYDPDFETLRLNQRAYRVVERNPIGYLVSINSPLSPTEIQLDANFQALTLSTANVFNIERTEQGQAVNIKQIEAKAHYSFLTDTPLQEPRLVEHLEVAFESAPSAALGQRTLSRGMVLDQAAPDRFLGETQRLPSSHPRVIDIVQVARRDSDDFISALLDAANRELHYEPGRAAANVSEALQRGYGECNDFADLLTTLARAAGIPARTVYGLAYQPNSPPAFAFHAWTEVHWDGRWQAMDPTFNQRITDATHIPLNDDEAALLMLTHTRSPVAIQILDYR